MFVLNKKNRHTSLRQAALLQRNFIKLFCLSFFSGVQLVIPIIVPLMQGDGLSMSQVLQTQAFFALVVTALELPSGYFADTFGRKWSLFIGSLAALLGCICLKSASSFNDYLLYEACMGVAVSLCSGADLALLYDTRLALGKREKTFVLPTGAKLFARLMSLQSFAEFIGGILATVFLFYSIEHVLTAQVVLAIVPVLVAYTLVEAPRVIAQADTQTEAAQPSLRSTLLAAVKRPLLLWIALTVIVLSLLGLYSFWLHQKFWALAGIELQYFGLIWAAFCLVRAVAAQCAVPLENALGPKKLLRLVCALPIIAILAMLFAPVKVAIALSLLFPLSRGLGFVVLIDAINTRIPNTYRATINSLINVVSRAVFMVTGPFLGLGVDVYGMHFTLAMVFVTMVPLFIFVVAKLIASIDTDVAHSEVSDKVAKRVEIND